MKLTVELIPETCWFSNVRSSITRFEWDKIKKQVSSAAWDCCEICGGVGPRHPVECHEVWNYNDETKVQKLVRMIALCPACHQVKHIGFAITQNRGEQARTHLMQVNGWSLKKANAYILKSFEIWKKRSQHDWTLNINVLIDYDIDIQKFEV